MGGGMGGMMGGMMQQQVRGGEQRLYCFFNLSITFHLSLPSPCPPPLLQASRSPAPAQPAQKAYPAPSPAASSPAPVATPSYPAPQHAAAHPDAPLTQPVDTSGGPVFLNYLWRLNDTHRFRLRQKDVMDMPMLGPMETDVVKETPPS
jgi:hypothetical protein